MSLEAHVPNILVAAFFYVGPYATQSPKSYHVYTVYPYNHAIVYWLVTQPDNLLTISNVFRRHVPKPSPGSGLTF